MNLVVSKARAAIEKYGVHLVVANQLQTRKNVVYLVYRSFLHPTTSDESSSSSSRRSLGVSTSGKELISYVNSVGASVSGKADLASLVSISISEPEPYAVDEIHRPVNEELIEPVLVEAVRQAHRAFVRVTKAAHSPAAPSSSSSSSSSAVAYSVGGGGAMVGDDCFSLCITHPTIPARFIKSHVDRFNQRGSDNNSNNNSSSNSNYNNSGEPYMKAYGRKTNKSVDGSDDNNDLDLDDAPQSSMEITVSLPRLLVGIGFLSVVAFVIGRISRSSYN